jgi:hypothetical protein
MNQRLGYQILFSVIASFVAATSAFADANALVDQAVSEYQAGKIDRAVPLLLQALKEDDKNGKAHYYLSCALRQLGQKEEAASQLEMAVKLCPEGMLQSLAKQVITNPNAVLDKPNQRQNTPQNGGSWWDGILTAVQNSTAGLWKMMPGAAAPSPSPNSSATPKSTGLFTFQMPDFTAGIREMYSNTRKMIRTTFHGEHKDEARPGSNSAATVISMGLMQELASSSHEPDLANKVSQPGGVMNYPQAPEFTPEWDQWIFRFRRIFNIVLTRHLLREAKSETTGTANVIFSLDNNGKLIGCIFSGSASDTLNNCLLQTIREIDHSRFLRFPASSRITGWNFRMQWDFGQLLTYIKLYRERQAQIQKLAAKQAALNTSAKIKSASQASLAAQIKKLPPTKPQVAQTPPPLRVKTGVAGMVLPKPKPAELKAVPLKLSDLIGRNVAPPPDMQDVIDAMNLDMEYEMSEEMQQQGVAHPPEQPTTPPDGKSNAVAPAH